MLQARKNLKHEIISANLPEISSGKLDISQADQELQQKVADFIEKVAQSGGSFKIASKRMQICIGPAPFQICFPIGDL